MVAPPPAADVQSARSAAPGETRTLCGGAWVCGARPDMAILPAELAADRAVAPQTAALDQEKARTVRDAVRTTPSSTVPTARPRAARRPVARRWSPAAPRPLLSVHDCTAATRRRAPAVRRDPEMNVRVPCAMKHRSCARGSRIWKRFLDRLRLAMPPLAPPHARQFDPFQDQRQILLPDLDTWRSLAVGRR